MNTVQKITSLDIPERLKQNAYKQTTQKKEGNLVINAGTDTGLGQELGKTLTALMEAEAGWVILFKDHDSIEEKLEHDNYPHDFAWVKGLERFLSDNYPHLIKEDNIGKMFEFGIPNSVIKSHLPEDVVEEYENQMPLEDGELTKPVLSVYNFLDHPDIREHADKIIWEENPHKPDTADITLSHEEFMDRAEEYIKGSVPGDLWEKFELELHNFLPNWSVARHTIDFEVANERKIRYIKTENDWDFDADEYAHTIMNRSFTSYDFDLSRTLLTQLNEIGGKGRAILTGKIAEAVSNDDFATASEISELLRNLRALQDFYETDKVLCNFKFEDGEKLKGVNPWTGRKSYMTTWKQYLQKLEEVDADVQVNYAEATEELIQASTNDYKWFTIESKKPICQLTALTHDSRGGSYAKSKMKSSESKRLMPEAIANTFEAEQKRVGMVSYSDYIHEGKYRDTDYPALYFGNFKGKNSLDDRDVLIVVGSPNIPWSALAIEHLLHFRQFPEFSLKWEDGKLQVDEETIETSHSIDEFKEGSLDIIYQHKVKKELRDASQRLRGQRDDEEKHLIMLGYCPELIYKHYENRERTNAYEFLKERLGKLDEIPELPFALGNGHLPEGLYRKGDEIVTREKIMDKEAEIIEDLKDLDRMSWKVARDYYGDRAHTQKVIGESNLLKFEGHGQRKYVVLNE